MEENQQRQATLVKGMIGGLVVSRTMSIGGLIALVAFVSRMVYLNENMEKLVPQGMYRPIKKGSGCNPEKNAVQPPQFPHSPKLRSVLLKTPSKEQRNKVLRSASNRTLFLLLVRLTLQK